MLKQSQNFIDAVAAFLKGEPIDGAFDWARGYEIAKMHSLSNLFYAIAKKEKNVPDAVLKKAKAQYLQLTSQQIQQDYFADELYQKLSDANIPFAPVKGKLIRSVYPDPAYRTSCDVDVFYDKTREKEAEEIMLSLGFQKEGEWMNGNVTIELHGELFVINEIGYDYYQKIWEKLEQKGGSRYAFSDEDFYIYFLAHSAKHFGNAGFGIRTVLDVYLFKSKKSLDEEYLNAELEKLSLRTFKEKIEKLSFVWFGGENADEETDAIGEYVIRCGTYGSSENRALMKGAGKGETASSAKSKYVFKTLFPPYKTMVSKYPFLRKVPFLLPVMWVYKWFEVLFTRRKKFKQVAKIYKEMSDEKVDLTNKVLKITQVPRI